MRCKSSLQLLSLVFSISLLLLGSLPAQALDGQANGPCGPPVDTPTVGGYVGGDSNHQTYTNSQGKKIIRVCASYRWFDGRVDHAITEVDVTGDNKCYSFSGLGTSTVTVTKLRDNYSVPSWQTGPEAGVCHPIEHLDIYLQIPTSETATNQTNSSPTPTSDQTAGENTTGQSDDQESNSDSNTNTPTDQSKDSLAEQNTQLNSNSSSQTDSSANSADSANDENNLAPQVLGQETQEQTLLSSSLSLDKILVGLGLFLILLILIWWWLFRRRRKKKNPPNPTKLI